MNCARVPRPCLVIAALLLAVLPSPIARHARAQPQPAPDDFAVHFRAQDTTVLVVEDPLPHLRVLLHSETLGFDPQKSEGKKKEGGGRKARKK